MHGIYYTLVVTARVVEHVDQQGLDVGVVQRQPSLVRVERGIGNKGRVRLHVDGALLLVIVGGEDAEPTRVADVLREVVHQTGGGPAQLPQVYIEQARGERSDDSAAVVIREIERHVRGYRGRPHGHKSGTHRPRAESRWFYYAPHTGPVVRLDEELLVSNRNIPVIVKLIHEIEVANVSIF